MAAEGTRENSFEVISNITRGSTFSYIQNFFGLVIMKVIFKMNELTITQFDMCAISNKTEETSFVNCLEGFKVFRKRRRESVICFITSVVFPFS